MPKIIKKVVYPPKLERKKRVAAYARVSSSKDAICRAYCYYIRFAEQHPGIYFYGRAHGKSHMERPLTLRELDRGNASGSGRKNEETE